MRSLTGRLGRLTLGSAILIADVTVLDDLRDSADTYGYLGQIIIITIMAVIIWASWRALKILFKNYWGDASSSNNGAA